MQSTMVRLAVVMTALMIGAVVMLEVLQPGDNSIAIGHILTIGIPTTAALLSLVRSSETLTRSTENSQRLDDISNTINGQTVVRISDAHAAGVVEGRADRRDSD